MQKAMKNDVTPSPCQNEPNVAVSASQATPVPVSDRPLYCGSRCDMIPRLTRITRDPAVMGGKPCLRGLRVTVGTVVGLVAAGHSTVDILALYPYLEEDDIREALTYAAWRVEEIEVPVRRPA